jgi:CBS domain-containing protein
MTRSDLPPRHTPVSACQGLLKIEPLLLAADVDVLVAMRKAAAQPSTRIIGVIDDDRRLVGVLPILRLAEAVVARVAPEAIMSGLTDLADIAAFGHTVEARTVGEAMLEPIAVTSNSTIDEAFRKMHLRRQSGLHVVDDEGRPTGYLDLLELALVYVDVLEVTAPEPSGPDASAS